MDLKQFKAELFARGTRAGFTDMEIYYQASQRFVAQVFKGELDEYTISQDGGLAFRGRVGGKMGYAYTEKIDESSLDLLLEAAQHGAEVTDSEEAQPIFAGSPAYEEVRGYNPDLEALEPQRGVDLLKELEAACYREDPRIASVQYCQFESDATEQMIANTSGLDVAGKVNGCAAVIMVVAREGNDTKSALRVLLTREFDRIDVAALAREVAGEAVSLLGAKPVATGQYKVALRNTAAASLLKAFVPAFRADNVQKGKSKLKGRLGEQVASARVSLIDDPFLAFGAETRAFDAEGVASRRLQLVEGGKLRTYLHNLKTAAVDGVEPTGHGHKSSYKGAVSIAPSNLYVRPGRHTREELVAGLDEGLLIIDVQGLHAGTNAISGDFSLAASGYYVKNGKVVHPVNQITVAGNFFDLLQQVEEVGSDLDFAFPGGGYVGSPTIRVKALTITGT